MKTISYAVTVYDELEEIQRLLPQLIENKRDEDEVVVIMDAKGPQSVWDYLVSLEESIATTAFLKFDNDFSKLKNTLTDMCTKDYVFQIDADEYLHPTMFESIPYIIDNNSVDLLYVPRINTVDGLTQNHIEKWNWNVNDLGWVNFPDYQTRVYRRTKDIRWEGNVHERITGFVSYAPLPAEEVYSLVHRKNIERQESQNKYYDTL